MARAALALACFLLGASASHAQPSLKLEEETVSWAHRAIADMEQGVYVPYIRECYHGGMSGPCNLVIRGQSGEWTLSAHRMGLASKATWALELPVYGPWREVPGSIHKRRYVGRFVSEGTGSNCLHKYTCKAAPEILSRVSGFLLKEMTPILYRENCADGYPKDFRGKSRFRYSKQGLEEAQRRFVEKCWRDYF